MFPQQYKIETDHTEPINWINYSPCGKHLVSISDDCTLVWNIQKESVAKCTSIPASEPIEAGVIPVVCMSKGGKMVAVCRGNLTLTIYNISGNSATKKEERDLVSEVKAADSGFGYKKNDRITALRFTETGVRIALKSGQQFSHIDVNLNEESSTIQPADNFGWSDLSVFAAQQKDPALVDQATRLHEKLQDELKSDDSLGLLSSLVKVPIDNNRYVGFMNRIIKDQFFF